MPIQFHLEGRLNRTGKCKCFVFVGLYYVKKRLRGGETDFLLVQLKRSLLRIIFFWHNLGIFRRSNFQSFKAHEKLIRVLNFL